MKAIALLTSLSLVAVVGCTDREEPTVPPPSETSRSVEPPPPSTLPETSRSMEPTSPPATPPPATSQSRDASPSSPTGSQMAQPGATPGGESATELAQDQELKKKIEAALEVDTSLKASAENIEINATNGIVTLQGSVPSEKEKEEIASKVKQMDGVQEVKNQLQVASR